MDEGEADVFKSELIGSRWLFELSQTQAKSAINTFSSTASVCQPPKGSRAIKERGLRFDTDRTVVKATIKASGDPPRHPVIGLLKCRGWGAEREHPLQAYGQLRQARDLGLLQIMAIGECRVSGLCI